MVMLVTLVLAATQPAIVLGVGSRASTLQVSEVGKPGAGLPKDTSFVMLTDVVSPRVLQRWSVPAMLFTRDATLGEAVTIEPRPPDEDVRRLGEEEEVSRYGRVRLGKVALHELLLEAGWAWVAPGARKDAALMKLEAAARAAKRGLWADPDPVEPWVWKELVMLRDAETKVVHSGWECPHVQKTQCARCGGGRAYALADAEKEGFTPHECFTPELLRIARASGGFEDGKPDGDALGAPRLPVSERRACKVDADCALTPETPCTCPGCGSVWRQAARKEVAARMTKNFAQANCGGVGCPACAGRLVGTKAVCRESQCAPAQ